MMTAKAISRLRLAERDLDFLVETAAPDTGDKSNLKKIIREDEDFRASFIGDKKVFRKLMDDDQSFLKISPSLFFEVLLRNAARELSKVGYTLERTRTMHIPVFDTPELVELLDQQPFVTYLADMLSTFTRIESYTVSFRIGKGLWKKIRFNDMDVISLIRFSEALEPEYRLGLYKRIADICLFIMGIFPEHAERSYRYPLSGEIRPQLAGSPRLSPEEYEAKGQKFYRLAAEHQAAVESELSYVFQALHEKFQIAKKPLNFIAEFYLKTKKHAFFS